MTYNARRCSARRKDGRPCRAWAVRESDEALCRSHLARPPQPSDPDDEAADSTAGTPGCYEPANDVEKIADLMFRAEEKDQLDELKVTRVAVRLLLEQLKEQLDAEDYARVIGLIFKGTYTIAGIMRAQRDLAKAGQQQSDPAIDAATEEFLKERNVRP